MHEDLDGAVFAGGGADVLCGCDEGGGVFGFCGGEVGDVFEAGVPTDLGDGVEGFLGGVVAGEDSC